MSPFLYYLRFILNFMSRGDRSRSTLPSLARGVGRFRGHAWYHLRRRLRRYVIVLGPSRIGITTICLPSEIVRNHRGESQNRQRAVSAVVLVSFLSLCLLER